MLLVDQSIQVNHIYHSKNLFFLLIDTKQAASNYAAGLRMASLFSEHVLLYPLDVLRRQIQVNNEAVKYHLSPVSVFPVLFQISGQGPSALWKGVLTSLAYNGLVIATDNFLQDLIPVKKSKHNQMQKLRRGIRDVAVRTAAYLLVSPIYYVMLIESVQSTSASDGNLLDGIRDTLIRFIPYSSSIVGGRSKMLPMWKILIPTVGLMTGRYICEKILYKIILPTLNAIQEADRYRKRKQRRVVQLSMDDDYETEENVLLFETTYASLIARIASGFFGQLLFYPVETIVHRLHVQGVRAIIDNTDTGVGVVPINSSNYYTDFWSCFKSIEETEGSSGLYKGIGCVLLKFSLLYGGMLLAHGVAKKFVIDNKSVSAPVTPATTWKNEPTTTRTNESGQW
jgi:solute carrier family 25 protein 46